MKVLAILALLIITIAAPVWAGEAGAFDPNQPFMQALSRGLLQAVIGHALEALDEYLEVSGSLDPDSSTGERKQSLRFKFYPEGKSQSDEHITAEGWLEPSEDSRDKVFHFRLAVPKSSAGPSSEQFDNVL